jgi:type II secretory ATPase GspE/PulE/Tfp pilus assembly ATPase PilB-like protein
MNSTDVVVTVNGRKEPWPVDSGTWSQLVAHALREPAGIHLVCGDTGIGVPFVEQALVNAAAAAGLKVAHQEFPLVNRPNWERAVRLSGTGHFVVLRLHARSLADLWRQMEALKVDSDDLEFVRSAAIAEKIDIRIARPACSEAAAPVFSEVALFDGQHTALNHRALGWTPWRSGDRLYAPV